MYHRRFLSPALAALLGLSALAVQAHEGHDDAPAAVQTSAAPRFAAVSEQFELVGVIEGHRLSLYLDHAADNSPVPDATLELELGGKPLAVTRVGEGLYQAELSQPLADGETPVTATVIAGADSDLLAADIDWHAPGYGRAAIGLGGQEPPGPGRRCRPAGPGRPVGLGAAAPQPRVGGAA